MVKLAGKEAIQRMTEIISVRCGRCLVLKIGIKRKIRDAIDQWPLARPVLFNRSVLFRIYKTVADAGRGGA